METPYKRSDLLSSLDAGSACTTVRTEGLNLTLVSIASEFLGLRTKLPQRWSLRNVARQPVKRCGDCAQFEVSKRNIRTTETKGSNFQSTRTAAVVAAGRSPQQKSLTPPPTAYVDQTRIRSNLILTRQCVRHTILVAVLQRDAPDTTCVNQQSPIPLFNTVILQLLSVSSKRA